MTPSGPLVLPLSAGSKGALQEMAQAYRRLLSAPDASPPELCAGAARRRSALPHRLAVVGSDAAELASALSAPRLSQVGPEAETGVIFLYTGQGSLYPGVGQELYQNDSVFRGALESCDRLLEPLIGTSLIELLFSGDREQLQRTDLAQPALVALALALTEMWRYRGVMPVAVAGHSVGEYPAAVCAGVLSASDALRLAAKRGSLMQAMADNGSMIAVNASPDQILPHLEASSGAVVIAAYNGPQNLTLSGDSAAVSSIARVCRREGIRCTALAVSRAFHSPLMDGVMEEFRPSAAEVSYNNPAIWYLSTLTGKPVAAGEIDADYWTRHIREPVRFSEAVETLAQEQVFLELGGSAGLCALGAEILPERRWLPSLRRDHTAVTADTMAALFREGVSIDWSMVYPDRGWQAELPPYPFQRVKIPRPDRMQPPAVAENPAAKPAAATGEDTVLASLKDLLHKIAGIPPQDLDEHQSLMGMGFDSLLVVRLRQAITRTFGVEIGMRELFEKLDTTAKIAEYLASVPGVVPEPEPPAAAPEATAAPDSSITALMAQQVRAMNDLFARQLEAIGGMPAESPAPIRISTAGPAAADAAAQPQTEIKGLYRRIEKTSPENRTAAQKAHLLRLACEYNARTCGSKEHTARHRDRFANSRSIIGFRREWKELIYPVTVAQSAGSKIWDVDGNEYVDITMGFGALLFGHAPAFVQQALHDEIARGAALGPQGTLCGEVAEMIHEMTGVDRVSFFTTGTEAVMVGTRIARAVTGREKVVVFANAYHGSFDGLLATGWVDEDGPTTVPVAAGTPQSLVDDVIVLPYGDPQSLEIVRGHGDQLAAVLVEPVQSRDPVIQPREFLHQLREITQECGSALLFDEIIVGFRSHPAGAQHWFGVEADLVTYGKVLGSGQPIGVLAGKRRFMDAVDGGPWRYGDDSAPESFTAFVAGTFNGHALSMAAARAVLSYLKKEGPGLQESLNRRTEQLCAELDSIFRAREVPIHMSRFASLFRFEVSGDSELLSYHLLNRGVFVWEGRDCFLSTAHSDDDIAHIVKAVGESIAAMCDEGWLSTGASDRQPLLLPLARTQQEMWFLLRSESEAEEAYHEMVALDLEGSLDRSALEAALAELIARHDSLRTVSISDQGQMVAPAMHLELGSVDISDDQAALTEALRTALAEPFDLAAGPLLRARLLRLSPTHHALALVVHHLVADGWSLGLIVGELLRLYTAAVSEEPAELPQAAGPVDFLAWENALATAGQPPGPQLLDQPYPVLELPADRPYPAHPGYRGARLHFSDREKLMTEIRALSQEQGVSTFMTFFAAFSLLLARLSDQTRFVVGIPYAGQLEMNRECLVGQCSVLLPVPVEIDLDQPFGAFLNASRTRLLSAYERAQRLFWASDIDEVARIPRINVIFNMDRSVAISQSGLAIDLLPVPLRYVKFDLFLNIIQVNDRTLFDVDFNTRLFDQATVERWLEHLFSLLRGAVQDPARPLGDLPLSASPESAQPTERVVDRRGCPLPAGIIGSMERRSPDGTWHPTGELARSSPDGSMEMLGAAARCLRRRQGRLLLDEVEAVLSQQPQVEDAAVVIDEGDELCAYLVRGEGFSAASLGLQLREILPAFKLPARVVWVDELQRSGGAIDYTALAALDLPAATLFTHKAPRNQTEQALCAIWSSVLGVGKVGVTDNFLDLGGHSLKAAQILARAETELGLSFSLRDLFEKPTVGELATLASGRQQAQTAIPIALPAASYPLSFPQLRLWLQDQLEPGLIAYNIPFAVKFAEKVDRQALQRALLAIGKRHQTLRTRFVATDGVPSQIITELPPEVFCETDLTTADQPSPDRYARKLAARPFDLEQGPLWRVELVTTDHGAWLVCNIHHIISDVWSLGVFVSELLALYSAEREGTEARLQDLPIQYRDFAVWQQQRSASESGDLSYWREQLGGELVPVTYPADFERPAAKTYHGASHKLVIDGDLDRALRELCRSHGASLFMVFAAAIKIQLSALTGQPDIVIGSVIAGRDHPQLSGQIGFYVNNLALRSTVDCAEKFASFLARVRQTVLEAFEHASCSWEEVVDQLRPARDPGRNPIFDVTLCMDDREDVAVISDTYGVQIIELETPTSQFDLTIYVTDLADSIRINLVYNTDLYREQSVVGFADELCRLLERAALGPDRPVAELSHSLTTAHAGSPTLYDLFERQAAARSDAAALVLGGASISYGELNTRANRLAHLLRDRGVGPDSLVGIYLDRSFELVVAVLGILKAGGAYVAFDPDYPAPRIAFMIQDTGMGWIVSESTTPVPASEAERVNLDSAAVASANGDNPDPVAGPENLCYVKYTSGSTGQPKGVMIEHRNLLSLLDSQDSPYEFVANDIWTMFHSQCFDVSVWEIFGALLGGSRLVIVPKQVARDTAALRSLLIAERVTILSQTPTAFYSLIEEDQVQPRADLALRYVILAGERLLPPRLRPWSARYPECRLINMYGTTETTVHATFRELSQTDMECKQSVIGHPLASLRMFVVDSQLRQQPVGVTGEILVGGRGVGRGYLNREELTQERFIRDCFGGTGRLYRTGDLGQLQADGELIYLGRIDNQVQIRGFRIECGEIEAQLLDHEKISGAVVMAFDDSAGNPQLEAFLVTKTDLALEGVRSFLGERLPDHMVPSKVYRIESVPMTSNGKVDRAALGNLDRIELELASDFVPPRTAEEKQLAEIWREVLGHDRAGVNDSFFELGGHSLRANQAVSRIRQRMQREVTLKDFFSCPNLGALAALVIRRPRLDFAGIEPVAPAEHYPVSFAQHRLWVFSQMNPGSAAYNMVGAFCLIGDLDIDALRPSFADLVRRHESLRTTFFSAGGEPRQRISDCDESCLAIAERDIRGCADSEAEIDGEIRQELEHCFDLETGPLFRVHLLRLDDAASGAQQHVLVLNAHHIICDGWSVAIVIRELAQLYRAHLNGCQAELQSLKIQYRDYSAWQRQSSAGEPWRRQREFWLDQFEEPPPELLLPTDHPRPGQPSGQGALAVRVFDSELSAALNRLAQQHQTTLFAVLATALQVLLYRLSGQRDLVIGSPIAGRNHVDTEGQVGFFLNLLPLRARLASTDTVAELLGKTSGMIGAAFENQDYPYDRLVEDLGPQHSDGRNPLFDVLIILQNNEPLRFDFEGVHIEELEERSVSSKYDLIFAFEDRPEIELKIDYACDLFEHGTIVKMGAGLGEVARMMTDNPGLRISELRERLIDPEEADEEAAFLASVLGPGSEKPR